jgi:hypothetical protein
VSVRRWSDDLPDPFTPDSVVAQVDAVLRSDFDTGQRARRLYRSPGRRVTLAAQLTGPEKSAFDAWWADDPWSLTGASDSLTGWTALGMSVAEGGALGADAVACPLVTVTATTGEHRLRRTLAPWGWGAGSACAVVLTVRTSGVARLRIGVRGRDETLRGAQIDPVAGTILSANSGVWASASEHRGRLRLRLSVPVGSGAASPLAHVAALDGSGNATFLGDGVATIELSQFVWRPDDGARVFLPTAGDGRALGAAEGAAWWFCPILSGHRYVSREVQAAGPPEAQPQMGLNWRVQLPVLVRDA